MNTKLLLGLAVPLAAAAFCGSAQAQNRPHVMREACWPGYHVSTDGSCQADNMVYDNRCPAGYIAHVFPDPSGYNCVPELGRSGGAVYRYY